MADASVFELFARLVLALALVIGLMLFSAKLLKKRGIDLATGRRGRGHHHQVDLLARRALTRNASVAVVRVGGRTLVLGVTDQHVTMLTEAQPEAALAAAAADGVQLDLTEEAQWTALPVVAGASLPAGSPWKTVLDTMRERTLRR